MVHHGYQYFTKFEGTGTFTHTTNIAILGNTVLLKCTDLSINKLKCVNREDNKMILGH